MEILFIILPSVKIITFNICACVLSHFSCVRLCNPWTVALRLFCPWDSPGKTTGLGCHALLQGNLSNPGIELILCLLHWQEDSLPLVPPGKPFNNWGSMNFSKIVHSINNCVFVFQVYMIYMNANLFYNHWKKLKYLYSAIALHFVKS